MSETPKKRKLSFGDLLPIPTPLKRLMVYFVKNKGYDPNQPSLEDLPNEILFLIFSFLAEKDIFTTSQTCTKFCQIFHQKLFWKTFVQTRWNTEDRSSDSMYNPLDVELDWKLYCTEKHLLHHPFHGMNSLGKYTWNSVLRETVCSQTIDDLPRLRTTLAFESPNPPDIEMSLPSLRESPSMCICEALSTIVVFGGVMLAAPHQPVPGFHFYNLESGTCVSYDISGLPENLALERHKMVCIGEDVYIFGGLLSGVKTNNLYRINLTTMTGGLVDVGETKPPARADHNMCVVMSRYIFLFGGSNLQTKPMDDLWIFDSHTCKWFLQECSGTQPYPRSAHGMTYWRNFVFVYGGGQWSATKCSWENYSNQLFALDVDKFHWTELKPKNSPEVDTFGVLCADSDSYFMTLSFGGKINTDQNTAETWIYDIVENDWRVLTSYHKPNDCAGVLFQDTIFFFGGYFPFKSLFETLRLNWKQPYHVYRKLHLERISQGEEWNYQN